MLKERSIIALSLLCLLMMFLSADLANANPTIPLTCKIVQMNYIVPIDTVLYVSPTFWDKHYAYWTQVADPYYSHGYYYFQYCFEFRHILLVADFSHTWIDISIVVYYSQYTVTFKGMSGFGWTYDLTYEFYLGGQKIATITKNTAFPLSVTKQL